MANRYMKRCSTSLIIKKCKSKPQWDIILHLLEGLLSKRQEITSVSKYMEKSEDGLEVLQIFKIGLPRDPAILLLCIYAKETKKIQKDICTSMFIAALFTTTKIWMNGKRNCVICTWWKIFQPLNRMKSCHLRQNTWTLRALC